MPRLLIRNGTLIDPSQHINRITDLLIEDGVVAEIGDKLTGHFDQVVEARGLLVTPGLVDMHVHLRDPGFTEKEDIYTGCNTAVTGGITSLLCMPNTKPVTDNEETIRYIQETAARTRAHVYVCAGATRGISGQELGDYQMYASLGVRAVSDDGRPVENDEMMERVLVEADRQGLLVTSHCEDLKIVNGGIINKGKVSEALQVRGIDRASEDSITKREIELAEKTNTRVHICHVSTRGSTELIRQAKQRGVRVTAETCPHYFALTEDKLLQRDADFRMNPPLREQADVDAIIEGIRDGTFDCITTDHAPHTKRDKRDFLTAPNGVVGMETSLAAGIRFLVEPGHIDMSRLIALMSTNPARLLGIPAGSLTRGMPADVALIDPRVIWTVLPERLHSKSKNSAFKFTQLQGVVKYTFTNGELAYVRRY